jgi:putative FmdB family regulatory protein
MPTYDYRCTRCKHRFELFHSITDDAPKRCPKCRSRAVRVPAGGAGLLFKGSGFYITDNRSKSYRDKARQEKSSEGSPGGGKSTSGKESGGKDPGGKKSGGESRRSGGS